jgi:hypothetical protein
MCFPGTPELLEPPKPPAAPVAVSKAPVSQVTANAQADKLAGLPKTSLYIPRTSLNIPS